MQRRTLLSTTLAAGSVFVTGGFAWLERWAAPDAHLLDPHWTRRTANSGTRVDHAPWAEFLQRFVVPAAPGPNLVRYGAVQAADRRALDGYLAMLRATRVTTHAADEQLAFWLNLYNALTATVILDHYPIESIRDITFGGRAGSGPWREKLIEIEQRPLSLDDIEHGIVRPVFGDPRIHYAVNCAAIGCPDLQAEPFRASILDEQLDAAANRFVNDPRGVRIATGGAVTVSSIYNWFRADFGGSEGAVLDHLRDYAEPPLRARLAGVRRIDAYAYDWRLNAV